MFYGRRRFPIAQNHCFVVVVVFFYEAKCQLHVAVGWNHIVLRLDAMLVCIFLVHPWFNFFLLFNEL